VAKIALKIVFKVKRFSHKTTLSQRRLRRWDQSNQAAPGNYASRSRFQKKVEFESIRKMLV
jgi:hypothetical protein